MTPIGPITGKGHPMFASPDHFVAWQKLQRTYRDGHIDQAAAMLNDIMPHFRETLDDLRLLFYIGFHADHAAYETALGYFHSWKLNPPERFDYRCATYITAIQTTIPAHIHQQKPYLVPLFLETTGYIPKNSAH